jgi:hypothetical protein
MSLPENPPRVPELTLAYVMPPGQDDFHLEILAGPGPGAAAQPEFADVDASLSVNGLNHVCIEVDSVYDTLAELRGRGVEVVNKPFELEEISAAGLLPRPVGQHVRALAADLTALPDPRPAGAIEDRRLQPAASSVIAMTSPGSSGLVNAPFGDSSSTSTKSADSDDPAGCRSTNADGPSGSISHSSPTPTRA